MRLITTYERYHRHVQAWAEREIDCLFVLGKPGTGKSISYKTIMGNRRHHLFSARKSPLQTYCDLYDAPNLPVVFDDISALLTDSNFIDMLKSLCETGRKVIRWGTTTSKLDNRTREFTCTSPVLIVLNRLPQKNPDVMAILDRCDGIQFEPNKREIIERMRVVFPDDGHLIDIMAELPVLPTLRTLVKARQWAQSKNLDLLEELFAECGVPEPVEALLAIMQAHPRADWCSHYQEATGLTDRTYRRHKAIARELLACRKSESVCPEPCCIKRWKP
jgi:hypothetical protein